MIIRVKSNLHTSLGPPRRVPGNYSVQEGDGCEVTDAGGKREPVRHTWRNQVEFIHEV